VGRIDRSSPFACTQSVISTLDSRITVFGLADVRGAVHTGFDEGAWIT
jgi:DHA2 family multidrug resistance protein